jgi:hypothetical protein
MSLIQNDSTTNTRDIPLKDEFQNLETIAETSEALDVVSSASKIFLRT